MQLEPEQLAAVTNRLKRAQGQIGGVIKMIEEGRDCQDIVTQLSAVSKAIDRAGFATISVGLRECLSQPDAEASIDGMEKLFLSLA